MIFPDNPTSCNLLTEIATIGKETQKKTIAMKAGTKNKILNIDNIGNKKAKRIE